MSTRPGNKQSGLSYLEMIVYISIFSFMVVGLVQLVLAMGSTLDTLRANRDMNRSARFVLERFMREVREGQTFDDSKWDLDPGTLDVDKPGGLETIFRSENGTIKMDLNGTYAGDLTLGNVTATSFVLRHIVSTSSEAVRLELTLEGSSGGATTTQTYYTTAVNRESY